MSMTLDRTARIMSIVQKRQPLVSRIVSVETNLGALDEALQDLEAMRDQLLKDLSDPLPQGRLHSMDVSSVRMLIGTELAALAKLRSRFTRETINIGVIGMARQGKSRLLQSLSGLTTNEIPDGKGSHCTGVRSTIYHDMQTTPHGEVFFHSEKSFISDVIGPYYRELKLEPVPRSLRGFADASLPTLSSEMKDASLQAKYEHLKKYKAHLESYANLLGSSPRRIQIGQVREYVAQDTVDEQRIYFNYLAARDVKIFCRFPNEDIGRIALIDMPGLGDTGIGDEERLVAVLGQDVDAVLFVKLPKATGDHWSKGDLDLYDTARKSLTDLPLEQWSFMVLNRTAQGMDNESNCKQLSNDIAHEHINVTQCIIADCLSPNETREKILDTILNYLAQNISVLDHLYASACQDRLNRIHGEVGLLLENAASALGRGTIVEGEFVKFDQLFKEVWTDLTNNMMNLLIELREWSMQPNDRLDEEVTTAIEHCRQDTGIPTLEEIDRAAKLYGAYGTAFNQYLHKVRTHLVQHFLSLEDTLHLTLEDVRSRVADALKSSGHLDTLAQSEGTAFLHDVAHLIPKELTGLKSSFETLVAVELTYRGFLQYRMRKHLMLLHPDGAKEGTQIKVASNAASVREALNVLHQQVIFRLEEAFQRWLSEPNLVAAAIVEEFVDNVLRAETAQDEWKSFYLEMRGAIWHTEFDKIGVQSRLRQEWDGLVHRTTDRNQVSALQIMDLHK